MRILDQSGLELQSPDLSAGKLTKESVLIAHHEAISAVEEQGHYRVIKTYEGGGQDVEWVVDIPGVEAKEAWDEYEEILRYTLYTAEELQQIASDRNKVTPVDLLESQIYWTAVKTGTYLGGLSIERKDQTLV